MDDTRLLQRAAAGDATARNQLLKQYRTRLRQLVATCMDARLAARIDPSDVVQDALIKAAGKLDRYVRDPPLPLYPWLRQITWECLIDLQRRHLYRQKRSVARERTLPAAAAHDARGRLGSLTQYIAARGPGPATCALRGELVARVRQALQHVDPRSRQVLVLRHLEERSTAETAHLLGISVSAVKKRHLVAVRRLVDALHRSHAHP